MSNINSLQKTQHIDPSIKIDKTAIIDKGVEIGNHSKIWQWVHICSGAVIGERCSFGQNVFVASKVNIGNNVKVQNNVSIYDNVVIEDNVFCGPSMVFTNVINPRAEISRKNEYKKTLIKSGVSLGANCTIICGTSIGEYAFIAAGAVVTKDVKPFALMIGAPARQTGWMSAYGEKIPLPLKGEGEWICDYSQTKYCLHGENMKTNSLN